MSPEYTVAPEARFPTQHEQCYAAVQWVREHGFEQGLSQSAFGIVGDTAGAQLATAVTILCSSRKPVIPVRYQVLINPVTDTVTTDRDTNSEFAFFNGPFNTVPFMRQVINEYIPDPDDRHSELATSQNISAAHAKSQPPTLIINSAADVLRDGGNIYGEILQRAGVDCVVLTAHGQLHDSLVLEATRSGATPKALMRLIAAQITNAMKSVKELAPIVEDSAITTRRLKKRRKVVGK